MTRLIVPALVALAAFPAAAQDANGLTFGGEVKLEYLDTSTSSHLWAFNGDVAMSWRSGGVLGFDASLDTTYLDDGTDFTNLWAALVLSTGVGEFALGAPRPLVDSLDPMPNFSSSRVVDLETSFLRGPITSLASTQDNGVTSGLTYVNTAGNLTYGGGIHHLNDGNNVDILEAVMQYKAGPTTFFISGEFANVDGPNISLMQIGAFHDAEKFDIGASITQADSSDTTHSLRFYGAYDVMPSLTVRGDVLMIQDASDVYSMSASYGLSNGIFVEGGGTKFNSGTEIYDIGVGFKF